MSDQDGAEYASVHAAVGCAVMLKCRTRRRWCERTTRTKSTRSWAVGTVKKSIETRSRTWFVRKVRQVCEGGVGRFGIRRETVRSATSIPSLRSGGGHFSDEGDDGGVNRRATHSGPAGELGPVLAE